MTVLDHDTTTDRPDSGTEPEPIDLLEHLTIDELNAGSRLLKASLVIALTEQNEHYERAMAVLVYLHERKADPSAGHKPADYFALSFTDVGQRLDQVEQAIREATAGPLDPSS